MRSVRLLFFIAIVIAGFACRAKKLRTGNLNYNGNLLDSLMRIHGNNLAIIPCIRCGCFVDSYNREFLLKKSIPSGYTLLTDTFCNRLKVPVQYINNNLIQSISDDFYNVVFIKKEKEIFNIYILEVEDSKRIAKLAERFFK